eukprot:5032736-Pyramimonas_sp.AAC.1
MRIIKDIDYGYKDGPGERVRVSRGLVLKNQGVACLDRSRGDGNAVASPEIRRCRQCRCPGARNGATVAVVKTDRNARISRSASPPHSAPRLGGQGAP